MVWEGWATLIIVAMLAVALLRNWARPDTVLVGGMTLLMTLALFSKDNRLPRAGEMAAGFGNEGLATIAALFVIAAALTRTGAMTLIASPLLGRPRSTASAQVRLMAPVALLSAFLNNTPIVAMCIPVVTDWSRKNNLPASKLFIPLSYAAILGGTCTLIGTSTNLVVHGLIRDALDTYPNLAQPQMFTIAVVGVPAVIVGVIYIVLASPKLLPHRQSVSSQLKDARRYTVEMLVMPGSAIDGRTIEAAGLRQLPGVYLAEVQRDEQRLVAVGPEQVLRGNDRLIFVGVVSSVVDLQKIRGLAPATEQVFKVSEKRSDRTLVEAVVSDRCPLIGRTIREGRFRTEYDAAVIAVHRGGQHMDQKIGDIELQPGDTLLLDTHPRFVDEHKNRPDFFLVSNVEGSQPIRHDRAWIAITLLAVMVASVAWPGSPVTLFNAALVAGGLMIVTRCISMQEALRSVDWRVLLIIGAAIGIGRALDRSGAAGAIANVLIDVVAPLGPIGLLIGVYLIAMLFNMMIGHVGAAVLSFPIAVAIAVDGGFNFMPFAICIMMAASADFANPVSYPTHLMVYGAGGYRFSDYVRIGLPLNILVAVTVITIASIVWPLS